MPPSLGRRAAMIFVAATVLVCAAPAIEAQSDLPVVGETRARLNLRGPRPAATFSIDAVRPAAARMQLEILDTRDKVIAGGSQDLSVAAGRNDYHIALPELKLGALDAAERGRLLWYRLRYQLFSRTEQTAAPTFAPAPTQSGVLSFSEISPDFFALSAVGSGGARAGGLYNLRVRAAHPTRKHPVEGVSVTATVELDAEDDATTTTSSLSATAVTDRNGFASFVFNLPERIAAREGDVRIVGRLGELTEKAEESLWVNRRASIAISTDKPLYQPGQTLHVRALVFDADRRALANQKAAIVVSEPEGVTAFRTSLTTSRFGVVAADWPIPPNVKIGEYRIKVELEEGDYGESEATSAVKISRYELPNFTVEVEPDKPYYLPGQSAQIEVRADYLFGRPVRRGSVRVVREVGREWNFREQKWETEEAQEYRGRADAEGRFAVRVDLAGEWRELRDGDELYKDLTYAAYVTDPTTNRTEQRRFDLRLTKDEIHIYVAEIGYGVRGYPSSFYVSTFYADGTPAPRCRVTVSDGSPDEDGREQAARRRRVVRPAVAPRRTIVTNQYGVAKLSDFALARVADGEEDEDGGGWPIELRASDARNRRGRLRHRLSVLRGPGLRVATDKSLYRDGEPIRVSIVSTESDLRAATIEVAREDKILHAEEVKLEGGRGVTEIAYRAEFRGELTIAAYSGRPMTPVSVPYGAKVVLYPHDESLRLDVKLNQSTLRPGAEARASVRLGDDRGRPVEAALGVVVFDKAVEERTRTDQNFGGGGSWRFDRQLSDLWRGREQISGVTRADLDRVDLTRPLPEGLDLVAEMLLERGESPAPQAFGGDDYPDGEDVFAPATTLQFAPLKTALDKLYARDAWYPTDEPGLSRALAGAGIDFRNWRDPWGEPYYAKFFVAQNQDVLTILSAGADKRPGTADDFVASRQWWFYFRPIGTKIDRALETHYRRTGRVARDRRAFERELRGAGLVFGDLRDRWGTPYRVEFNIQKNLFQTLIRSDGPDRRQGTRDDFTAWNNSIDSSENARRRIDDALDKYFERTKKYPRNERQLRVALLSAGVKELPRDLWNRTPRPSFVDEANYGESAVIVKWAKHGERAGEKTIFKYSALRTNRVVLTSRGADGKAYTADDFLFSSFTKLVPAAEARSQKSDRAPRNLRNYSGECAIGGVVTDAAGAVIPGVTVRAERPDFDGAYETKSDDEGQYVLRGLTAGTYEVSFDLAGFKRMIVQSVTVGGAQIVEVNAALDAGAVAETVEVSAEAVRLETASASVSAVRVKDLPLQGRNISKLLHLAPGAARPDSTPRLREYFPETLLWQPEVVTGAGGAAQINFKLADNITTWKMSIVGSTVDGRVGAVEKEIRAFQPFFVEHDPPRVLTEGDEIDLPVVLRNYLDRAQQVAVEMKLEPWFRPLGPSRRTARVAAGDAARTIFGFAAVDSVGEGKQRVTAVGADEAAREAGDAVERAVNVHPHGEEVVETTGRVFSAATVLDARVPPAALPRTVRAELKIYPNLLAHVVEGIEGIMQRPYGCGEQTISSTYPSLLLLRHYRRNRAAGELPAAAARARRYVELGYQRLLSYRTEDGGFSYWGRGDADLALTAYALRFLRDAAGVIEVDAEVADAARDWLSGRQGADGSWKAKYGDGGAKKETALLTAYVTRVIAAGTKKDSADRAAAETVAADATTAAATTAVTADAALALALDYLARRTAEIDEPYLLASYTLAARDAGRGAEAAPGAEKLRGLARAEADGSYWSLETNTPFYGWGLAGRVETTALALQALSRANTGGETARTIDRGLVFLLSNKDRYGVWLSTQATVNVLDALTTIIDGAQSGQEADARPQLQVTVGGRLAQTLTLPPGGQLAGPVTIDLSTHLAAGSNSVELRRVSPGGEGRVGEATQAQLVTTYYRPWEILTGGAREKADALRLSVDYDRTEAGVNQEITCRVGAERAGFGGYGMMLAEIGLPPGAEVDRASLERTMRESGWAINSYDVAPDRLIVYLWPAAGGVKFDFKFRMRYAVRAMSAASTLYDYYNPEARVVVAPKKFVVRRPRGESPEVSP